MNAGNAFAKAGDGELGRGGVVHLEARSAREVLPVCLQGDCRDEHRRLVSGTGRVVATRYLTSRVGNAQERRRRLSRFPSSDYRADEEGIPVDVVHLEAQSYREVLVVCVQGVWRDEHRRLLVGTGRLVATGYPTSRVGNAQERPRRVS